MNWGDLLKAKIKGKEKFLSKNLRMMTVFKMESMKYLFKDP